MHASPVCCDFTEVRQQVLAACHVLSWGPGSLLSSGVQTLVVVWSCVVWCGLVWPGVVLCGRVCVFLRVWPCATWLASGRLRLEDCVWKIA